ncbi:uncharacterized protein LOC121373103 [Gigantopelta aegis]|uniref:uncharacterized protein LOC121373103 n=1 Tax=Gigantopelta aegis TaxID=1735272 RepID=UPI001B8881E7|nr:uncharacterized protein LOC121373103 [Gigantopelta aegis]
MATDEKQSVKGDDRKTLEQYYFNPRMPGSFYGPSKFQKSLKRRSLSNFKLDKVKNFLNDHEAYSLHKPVRQRFRRLKVRVNTVDEQFDLDLADVSRYSKWNDGMRYLLVANDILSRYAWVVPLRNKKPETVLEGFKSMLKDGLVPKKVRVDKGGEFRGVFRTYAEKMKIKLIVTQNENIKANYVERLDRTLKSLLTRFMTHNNTKRYLEVLQDLIYNYNHTIHASLGKWAPAEVNHDNQIKVWRHLYLEPIIARVQANTPLQKFVFNVDDLVRISYLRKPFTKELDLRWTEELFKIVSRIRRQGIPIYRVKDFHDELIEGSFYTSELQRVKKDQDVLWKVETILK